MISIKEIYDLDKKRDIAKDFGVSVTQWHRCFAAKENGADIAFGAMIYQGGVCVSAVEVKSGGDSVYDLLVRSMMNVLRDMKGIRIYTKLKHFSFSALGFHENGDTLEIISDNLNFGCAHK